jgi:hypothetical protein
VFAFCFWNKNEIFNVEICESFLLFLDQFLDENVVRQIVLLDETTLDKTMLDENVFRQNYVRRNYVPAF